MKILKKISIRNKLNPDDFLKFAPKNQSTAIEHAVQSIRGTRVVHINATEEGGGVAEILHSLITYLRSLGIQADWYVIDPDKTPEEFFQITNKLHNALQGAPTRFTKNEWGLYESINKKIADDMGHIDCDILVVHDPQPLLSAHYSKNHKRKIFYSHIDTSSANRSSWKKIFPYMKEYDCLIFSNKDFVHGSLPKNKVHIFTPAIDPLALKQKIVPRKKARKYLKNRAGIPEKNPLIVQVSRFDIWKNPLGVIEGFRIVQNRYPEANLALVGFNQANDNPAAKAVYRDIQSVAENDKNVYLFFDPHDLDPVEFTLMAQNAADIIVQNSIKEGFGLVVAEAMWKEKPVIGGPAAGIKKQIINGKNGFIVKSPEELAKKITYLLNNPKIRRKMGRAAKRIVTEKFLFPRYILDHLRIYNELI